MICLSEAHLNGWSRKKVHETMKDYPWSLCAWQGELKGVGGGGGGLSLFPPQLPLIEKGYLSYEDSGLRYIRV